MHRNLIWGLVSVGLAIAGGSAQGADPWIVLEGTAGIGQGKQIVLVSGDEEYRSEEALPQLAKILSQHHGFRCTVLFAIDPASGEINPNIRDNIPGLEALKTADLLVIATRFRDLPDEQMQHVADYVESVGPSSVCVPQRTRSTIRTARNSPSTTGKVALKATSKALDGKFWARPGSATMVSMGARARGGSRFPVRSSIRFCAALTPAPSGALPMSMEYGFRCPATASPWSWELF